MAELASHLEQLRERTWLRLDDEEPAATEFLRSVARALPDEAVVVCDMCIPGYWLGGFHRPPAPRRLLYPLGWGTLGCAFPQALGAALAGAGPAVSVSGDGGFLYACGELATMAQEQIPLTAVIVDDGGYGMLRYDQQPHGRPALRRRPPDARLRGAGRDASGSRPSGRRAWATSSARRSRATCATRRPSVLVAKAALDPPPNTSPRWYRRPDVGAAR